ncbi:MAG TPA: lectin-like protein [Candidatus Angelobacter sp.]|nr:lectin-like protein [Candidatus Angelobacter sp.]
MKIIVLCCCVALTFAAATARAGIITGPITNPGNRHDYYLLTPETWTASEAEAEKLGGTLAVIKNAGEQEWVSSTFSEYGGINRNLWIGMRRSHPGGPLAWVTDTPIAYSNWDPGQPDNAGGNESFVHMLCRTANRKAGTWNDLADGTSVDGAPICGVVEVVEKTKVLKALHALVGQWYEEGNAGRPCYVAASGDAVFAINDSNHFSGRIGAYKNGTLFVAPWQVHGEVVQDKILWSNGTWWSRTANEDDFQLEGLDRAVGPRADVPVY